MKAIGWLSGFGNNEEQKSYDSRITSFSPYLSPNHSFRVSLRTAELFPPHVANSIHSSGFATSTPPPSALVMPCGVCRTAEAAVIKMGIRKCKRLM